MAAIDLWVEKYRPAKLEGYVFKNEKMREQIQEWVSNPQGKKIPIPHLLFSGVQGTGKTTLARALCRELNVEPADIMEINASRENNVETVREKIVNFCSTWPIGEYKIIILDEVDGFSHAAQKILRGEMEKHADTARFILTCNYPKNILPALHSRTQGFHFDALDMESFVGRIVEILATEGVDFNPEDIQAFINISYPDLRKCINLLDQHTRNGKLQPIEETEGNSHDYLNDVATLFREGRYTDARKLVTSQARPEDYEEIYRYFYKNLELWSDNEDGQNQAIIYIAKGLRDHAIVADPEINLAATMISLSQIQ